MSLIPRRGRPERKVLTLEESLEAAWCRLTDLRCGSMLWVYVTPGGRVMARPDRLPDPLGAEVGHFNRDVSLTDFRQAVFHGFEQMRRAR